MKVFKAKKSKEKKTYIFAFEIDDEKYTISFEGKKVHLFMMLSQKLEKKLLILKERLIKIMQTIMKK